MVFLQTPSVSFPSRGLSLPLIPSLRDALFRTVVPGPWIFVKR